MQIITHRRRAIQTLSTNDPYQKISEIPILLIIDQKHIKRTLNGTTSTFLSPTNNVFTTSSRSQSTYINNNTNNNNGNDDDDASNPTVCNCGTPAPLITVKKDGPSKGKEFYSCGNNKACKLFLWKDGGGGSGGSGG